MFPKILLNIIWPHFPLRLEDYFIWDIVIPVWVIVGVRFARSVPGGTITVIVPVLSLIVPEAAGSVKPKAVIVFVESASGGTYSGSSGFEWFRGSGGTRLQFIRKNDVRRRMKIEWIIFVIVLSLIRQYRT